MQRSHGLLALLGAFALLLAASCDQGGEVVKGLEELEDKACACEDPECADEVLDELRAFARENVDAKGNEENLEKAEKAMQGFFKCVVEAGASREKLREAQQEFLELSQK